MDHLTSLELRGLNCKSWVSNEFLDLLTCYDLPESGLDKLNFSFSMEQCEPLEGEVVTRLANMCPRISHLQLTGMTDELSEAVQMSMFSLFR